MTAAATPALRTQARYLAWAFEAARANPNVQMFVWFVFRDRSSVPWKGGIETEGGRRKAGFASFSTVESARLGEIFETTDRAGDPLMPTP